MTTTQSIKAWQSTKWWNWCLLEDEKEGIEPIFTDKVGTLVYKWGGGISTFWDRKLCMKT